VGESISRREFLAVVIVSTAVVAIPSDALEHVMGAGEASTVGFLDAAERRACTALCARIVPTDADPGATEARAVDVIDRFLSAFELPRSEADNPGIWLRGPFSGRNPYPDPSTGQPSGRYPAGFRDLATGATRFLPLTRQQELAWRARLFGPAVITANTALPGPFREAVRTGLIPCPPGLHGVYRDGLAALDSLAAAVGGHRYADLPTSDQDAILLAAGGLRPLPGHAQPEDAVKTLVQNCTVHTYQACWGLPEYGGNPGGIMWSAIAWEGDTQPLGNSVYSDRLTDAQLGPEQGGNTGFGDPAVATPRGGYREHRPVSTAGPDARRRLLTSGDVAAILSGSGPPS
jgi:gluconate 2-dehydrogenase subunit 3-like protein